MKKITFLILSILLCGTSSVMAQFTFPTITGPTAVTQGSPVTLNLNDSANSASVTSGQYASATVQVMWEKIDVNTWSEEARLQFKSDANDLSEVLQAGNSTSDGAPVTLVFDVNFDALYNPDVEGNLDIVLSQVGANSSANWSDIIVTLNAFVPPTTPTTVATLTVNGCDDMQTTTNPYNPFEVSPDAQWIELVWDGGCSELTLDTLGSDSDSGNDDDTEIGLYDANGFLIMENDDIDDNNLLSAMTLMNLPSGTYYIAVAAWDVTFAPINFNATTNEFSVYPTGSLTVNANSSGDPLSLENFEIDTAFSYYPNPVRNVLNFKAENNITTIAVYNALGQEVLKANPNAIDTKLDMSSLQAGTYIVRVSIENITKAVRIIKQ